MPKIAKVLSPVEVNRLSQVGWHAVGGAAGLLLQVRDPAKEGGPVPRSWILRVRVDGERQLLGLGSFPEVSLAQAREDAKALRDQVRQGVNPRLHRQAQKSARIAAAAKNKTFKECALAFMDAKSAEWKNPKHRQQWSNTLEQYANPVIGSMLVRDVTLTHVLEILEPVWKTRTETASRVRGRIEAVLDWATVRGHRALENPARWRGHLDKLLAAPKKVARVEHHAALPIDEMPAFMKALREQKGLGARALEFLVLTAARSGEVRGAAWDEIDLDNAVWTIPGERMKAGREGVAGQGCSASAWLGSDLWPQRFG